MRKITTLFALLVFAVGFGQGSESFDNFNPPANYNDGTFVGDDGFTWTYVQARIQETYPIDGNGIMLRRADEPSSLSATIDGGIGDFSVDTRKAYSGNADRTYELLINDNVVATHTPAFADGEDDTVIPFVVTDINVEGEFTLEIRAAGATGNQQMILDN